MRALIAGTVVDTDENAWDMNGRSGVTLKVFVQSGSPREAAVGIRVSERQFGACTVGQVVLWAIDVQTFARDNGQAQLRVSLALDQDPSLDAELPVAA